MNDQEKQIISDIFRRLEATAGQTRDPEVERLIADKVRAQPYAPYAMAQSLYVQEEALKSLNGQLEQLRAENEQLQQQGGQQQGSGGFLSSIFGGGQQRPQPDPRFGAAGAGGYGQPQPGYAQGQGGPWGGQQQPQQGGPWGGQQQPQQGGPWGGQQQPQAAGGGGFLRGALTTAAGVAGGMVVGGALMNAFSGGHSSLGQLSNTDMASMGGLPGGGGNVQDAVWDQPSGGAGGGGEAAYQDASYDDAGGSDESSWD